MRAGRLQVMPVISRMVRRRRRVRAVHVPAPGPGQQTRPAALGLVFLHAWAMAHMALLIQHVWPLCRPHAPTPTLCPYPRV